MKRRAALRSVTGCWGTTAACAVLLSAVLACDTFKGPPEVKFETVKVDKGTVSAKVTASGTLNALVTVQVGTQVSGRVSEIHVDFNSVVKKGQVIARIDPRFFVAALDQAKANEEAALGSFQKAEVDAAEQKRRLDRANDLATQQSLARYDAEAQAAAFESAAAQVKVAKGMLSQARANVKQAEINLQYSTIYSPIDGMVISRAVDVGQTVAASFQSPVLFTIAEDLRKMQVEASVSEADIGKLKDGMETTFTVDAYPGQRFRGTVRQIRNAPINLQNVITYTVIVDVDNKDMLLKPGMTATVGMVHAQRESVLRLPNPALRFRPSPEVLARFAKDAGVTSTNPEQGRLKVKDASPDRRTVWLLRDGVPVPVPLRTGITDGSLTEILEGELDDGDRVVTEAQIKGGGGGSPGAGPGGNPMMRRVL